MALSRLTCPICLATLKPAQPVEEGARVRCPKCKGAFVAEGELPAEEAAPEANEPPPEEEEMAVAEAADDDVTEEPPRRARGDREDDEDDRPRRTARRRDDDDEEEEEDRPRRKSRRKGGVPVWVWLAGGGVGLLLLCGCCGVGGWAVYSSVLGFGGISATNYTALKRGMSENEVRWRLGTPTSARTGFGGIQVNTWQDGTDFITVTFQNDKAVGRACNIQHNGVIQMQDSGILPW